MIWCTSKSRRTDCTKTYRQAAQRLRVSSRLGGHSSQASPAQRRAEALGHMARAAGSPLARSVRTHSVRRSCYSTVGRALDTLIEAQQLATQIKTATRSKIE